MATQQGYPGSDGAAPLKGITWGWMVDNNGHVLLSAHDVQLLQELGVQLVRFEARLGGNTAWSAAALAPYVQVMQMLQAAGITPLVLMGNDIVHGANRDAWNANAREEHPEANGDNPFIDQFVDAATTIVQQLPAVSLWEIWNEPNNWAANPRPGVWETHTTYIFPSVYAVLLRKTYHALKALPGERTIMSGGLLALTGGPFGPAAARTVGASYLDALYRALRAAGAADVPFDALGQHFYLDTGARFNPESLNTALTLLDQVVAAHEGRGRQRPMYVTEAGWQSPGLDEETQAENLGRFFASCARVATMQAVCWFLLRDNPAANLHYGLRNHQDQPKPAFDALRQAPGRIIYTVQPGDNLSTIGAQFGVDWQRLYDLNRAIIGEDPNLIQPGQRLTIPSA